MNVGLQDEKDCENLWENALRVFVSARTHVFISANIKSKNELDFFH